MGLLFFSIIGIILLVSWYGEYSDRKELQRRAEANGEQVYEDRRGCKWVGDHKCIEHWINGRHVLTYLNDKSVIVKDYTAEEEARVNRIIDAKKRKVNTALTNARRNGKLYAYAFIDLETINCETSTGKYYLVINDNGKYYKAYYNIIWKEWKNEYVCVDIKNISKEEAKVWCDHPSRIFNGSCDIPVAFRFEYYKAKKRILGID